MMMPKRPSADAKISMTSTLTNNVEFCASDNAALLPTTPTDSLRVDWGCKEVQLLCVFDHMRIIIHVYLQLCMHLLKERKAY